MSENNEIEKYDHLNKLILDMHREIDENDLDISKESIFKIISCPILMNPNDNEEIYYIKNDIKFERLIRNRQVLRDYKKGLAIKRIAEKYNISTKKVQQIIKSMINR